MRQPFFRILLLLLDLFDNHLIVKKYNKVITDLQGTKTPCQQKILSYRTYLLLKLYQKNSILSMNSSKLSAIFITNTNA